MIFTNNSVLKGLGWISKVRRYLRYIEKDRDPLCVSTTAF